MRGKLLVVTDWLVNSSLKFYSRKAPSFARGAIVAFCGLLDLIFKFRHACLSACLTATAQWWVFTLGKLASNFVHHDKFLLLKLISCDVEQNITLDAQKPILQSHQEFVCGFCYVLTLTKQFSLMQSVVKKLNTRTFKPMLHN